MRHFTSPRLPESAEHRNAAREESAGPCPNEGCGGTLAIQHNRQFGRVYTVCEACERRVSEVRVFRATVDRLQAAIAQLRAELDRSEADRQAAVDALTPALRESAAKRAAIVQRNAEIARRYLAGESGEQIGKSLGLTAEGVFHILERRGVPRRKRGPVAVRVPRSARRYFERPCARPGCGASFMPTGPRARYCDAHSANGRRRIAL